ncbi:ShlB/FhaC/HecB family hemolysin secretion/activation protein, partial [Enterobacteriaceae bacterium H6W4]|nr:ShlB/FhaC/HecB family hemolysin secretion/activation protein [Dryocola boscaweniae]
MSSEFKCGLYGLACCVMVFAFSSFAAPLSPADRNTIEQQQQNLLEQNQRQRDELDRSAELPRFTSPEP